MSCMFGNPGKEIPELIQFKDPTTIICKMKTIIVDMIWS